MVSKRDRATLTLEKHLKKHSGEKLDWRLEQQTTRVRNQTSVSEIKKRFVMDASAMEEVGWSKLW